MRQAVLKTLAIVMLLVQLGQASGGLFCGQRRVAHADGCGTHQALGGAVLKPAAPDTNTGRCAPLGPCAVPLPAIAAAPVTQFALALVRDAAAFTTPQLYSITSAPIPPPPQA